jgi:bifunctional ADP-heptose synthase (sugar kinase/adenylyltransferase)
VLSLLKPDSLVFGEDLRNEARLQQRIDQVKASSPGTKIQILPRHDEGKISTSSIIKKIRSG